jgi:hypothetical protein
VLGAVGLLHLLLWRAVDADNLGSTPDQSCEFKARQAYWNALKLCQFENNGDPRLRCYEAAREVYMRTLEECGRSP